MNLVLPIGLASNYKSKSQIIRVITENWVEQNIFCPSCGGNLTSYENNRPVADLFCAKCVEDFELKSKKNCLGSKINDGAYQTMIEQVINNKNPNFFFLSYQENSLEVNDFMIIPKHFFTEDVIEKRKPLSLEAKRAGWTGCNILFNLLPESGKIFYIKNQQTESKDKVLEQWSRTVFLRSGDNKQKGWLLDIIQIIEQLKVTRFSLSDIYLFEDFLKQKHPENNNIKAKIRQQLQIIRDGGYLKFTARGVYEVI